MYSPINENKYSSSEQNVKSATSLVSNNRPSSTKRLDQLPRIKEELQ